jgi:hypothetical protein
MTSLARSEYSRWLSSGLKVHRSLRLIELPSTDNVWGVQITRPPSHRNSLTRVIQPFDG